MRNRHKKPEDVTTRDLYDVLERPAQTRSIIVKRGGTSAFTAPVKIRRFAVCWGIPMDELCFSLWVSNFMHLPVMPWDHMAFSLSTYLSEARNFIHQSFLDMDKSCEWLVMLDSDVLPPPDFLDRLLAHNKKLVGGWYRKKGGKNEPVVYDAYRKTPEGKYEWHNVSQPGSGLQSIAAAGAGCWLMHRDIAEAIGREPYDTWRGGEDLEMCLKVKEKGFDIFIDWSIACAHAGVAIA